MLDRRTATTVVGSYNYSRLCDLEPPLPDVMKQARFYYLSALLPLLTAIFVRYKIIIPPTKWCQETYGSILGEEYIQSKQDAFKFAERAVEEGYSMWEESSSNWETM